MIKFIDSDSKAMHSIVIGNELTFHYNGTVRIGRIEKIGLRNILVKHTIETSKKLGHDWGWYNIQKLIGENMSFIVDNEPMFKYND